jgi:hypothetical protein
MTSEMVNKLCANYGNGEFVTVFTKAQNIRLAVGPFSDLFLKKLCKQT